MPIVRPTSRPAPRRNTRLTVSARSRCARRSPRWRRPAATWRRRAGTTAARRSPISAGTPAAPPRRRQRSTPARSKRYDAAPGQGSGRGSPGMAAHDDPHSDRRSREHSLCLGLLFQQRARRWHGRFGPGGQRPERRRGRWFGWHAGKGRRHESGQRRFGPGRRLERWRLHRRERFGPGRCVQRRRRQQLRWLRPEGRLAAPPLRSGGSARGGNGVGGSAGAGAVPGAATAPAARLVRAAVGLRAPVAG